MARRPPRERVARRPLDPRLRRSRRRRATRPVPLTNRWDTVARMPLNRDFIGREYPSDETYEVSRELIRRFADAIGDANPAYRDVEAAKALGYPDVIAPP